jgi:hypothetical protein
VIGSYVTFCVFIYHGYDIFVFSARCTPRVTMNAVVCYASLHHNYSYRLNDKSDGWKQNILEISVANVHILESWQNKSTSSCLCTLKTNQISTAGLQSLDPYMHTHVSVPPITLWHSSVSLLPHYHELPWTYPIKICLIQKAYPLSSALIDVDGDRLERAYASIK